MLRSACKSLGARSARFRRAVRRPCTAVLAEAATSGSAATVENRMPVRRDVVEAASSREPEVGSLVGLEVLPPLAEEALVIGGMALDVGYMPYTAAEMVPMAGCRQSELLGRFERDRTARRARMAGTLWERRALGELELSDS